MAQQQSKDPVFLWFKAQAPLGQSGFEVGNKLIVKASGQLVLPIIPPDTSELWQQILKDLHESPLGGYLGQHKLYALVSQHFFWTKLDAVVRRFCRVCSMPVKYSFNLGTDWTSVAT